MRKLVAMPYVKFSINVKCEYLYDVCLFILFLVCFTFPSWNFPSYLETSYDEILIRYKSIGIVFS